MVLEALCRSPTAATVQMPTTAMDGIFFHRGISLLAVVDILLWKTGLIRAVECEVDEVLLQPDVIQLFCRAWSAIKPLSYSNEVCLIGRKGFAAYIEASVHKEGLLRICIAIELHQQGRHPWMVLALYIQGKGARSSAPLADRAHLWHSNYIYC